MQIAFSESEEIIRDLRQHLGIDLVVALAKLAKDRMPGCTESAYCWPWDGSPVTNIVRDLWRIAGGDYSPRIDAVDAAELFVPTPLRIAPSPAAEVASPGGDTVSLPVPTSLPISEHVLPVPNNLAGQWVGDTGQLWDDNDSEVGTGGRK